MNFFIISGLCCICIVSLQISLTACQSGSNENSGSSGESSKEENRFEKKRMEESEEDYFDRLFESIGRGQKGSGSGSSEEGFGNKNNFNRSFPEGQYSSEEVTDYESSDNDKAGGLTEEQEMLLNGGMNINSALKEVRSSKDSPLKLISSPGCPTYVENTTFLIPHFNSLYKM
jgi:hypothetical protein